MLFKRKKKVQKDGLIDGFIADPKELEELIYTLNIDELSFLKLRLDARVETSKLYGLITIIITLGSTLLITFINTSTNQNLIIHLLMFVTFAVFFIRIAKVIENHLSRVRLTIYAQKLMEYHIVKKTDLKRIREQRLTKTKKQPYANGER